MQQRFWIANDIDIVTGRRKDPIVLNAGGLHAELPAGSVEMVDGADGADGPDITWAGPVDSRVDRSGSNRQPGALQATVYPVVAYIAGPELQ
jgi:hypothetical protein